MQILTLGHNHDTAPVEIRERFAFGPDRINDALVSLLDCSSVRESVILSTCNRNEIYTVVTDTEAATKEISDFMHDFHQIDRGLVSHSLYTLQQDRAVDHLFSVASGIDSMMVGETQVLGQLKDAFRTASAVRAAGPILNRLFSSSFETSKKVRSGTHLSEGSVSISSCAIDLASKIFTDFTDKLTVLVGAGENSEQTARILREHGAAKFIVANRTVERAAALADRLGGSGVPLEKLRDVMVHADIVLTSTSSPDPILTDGDMRLLMQKRRNRPLFIIDLSVPRDVDPAVRQIHNVFLYDVDDLSSIAKENKARRSSEVVEARTIIDADVSTFMGWYRSLDVTPTIVSLRQRFEEVRKEELDKMQHKLTPEEFSHLDGLSRSIVNKLLHPPTAEIKAASASGDHSWLALAVRRLFRITEIEDK